LGRPFSGFSSGFVPGDSEVILGGFLNHPRDFPETGHGGPPPVVRGLGPERRLLGSLCFRSFGLGLAGGVSCETHRASFP